MRIPVFKSLLNHESKSLRSWESEACDGNGRPLDNIELNKHKILQVINIESWCDMQEPKEKDSIFTTILRV